MLVDDISSFVRKHWSLVKNSGISFGLGVACLNECLGNDCRAALLFLAQIIGYKTLRVSTDTTLVLQAASGAI